MEKTKRSRGERLKKDKVKTEIIRYILSKNDIVPGPDLIKYLQENFNIVDEKNIRIHLKNLQKQHCIEKIPHEPGLDNKWKIEKIKNLQNIQEHYPDIQLNTYDKSINIVLEEQTLKGYLFGDYFIHRRDLRFQLSLSDSFFSACLSKDIKTLCDEAYEYYKYGEGFEECNRIQCCIYKFYNECIKPLSISPKIWLAVSNVNTSNFSELEIYQNAIKNLPDAKISEETFREILEDDHIWRFGSKDWEPRFIEESSIKLADMACQKMLNKIPTESQKIREKELKAKSVCILREMLAEIPGATESSRTKDQLLNEEFAEILALKLAVEKGEFGEWNFIFLRELSAKITYEIFQTMFKEIPVELLDTPEIFKILIEILKKILQEVLKKIQVLPDEMYILLTEITAHRIKIEFSLDKIMFKHYFDRDIEDGTISSDEREYMVMTTKLQTALAEGRISGEDARSDLDQFFKDHIKNT